jgi:hypothetical protein
MGDVKDAQPLLPELPKYAAIRVEVEVDVVLILIGIDLGVEHAPDGLYVLIGPQDKTLLGIGLEREDEGLIGNEVAHMLGELQHVTLLLLVSLQRLMLCVILLNIVLVVVAIVFVTLIVGLCLCLMMFIQ